MAYILKAKKSQGNIKGAGIHNQETDRRARMVYNAGGGKHFKAVAMVWRWQC